MTTTDTADVMTSFRSEMAWHGYLRTTASSLSPVAQLERYKVGSLAAGVQRGAKTGSMSKDRSATTIKKYLKVKIRHEPLINADRGKYEMHCKFVEYPSPPLPLLTSVFAFCLPILPSAFCLPILSDFHLPFPSSPSVFRLHRPIPYYLHKKTR